jgi:NADH-quinone oxidoreductase subunit G
MNKDYPQFAVLDHKPSAEWADIGVAGKLSKDGFTMAITDFYGTNPIARSSETMDECRDAMNGANQTEGATGTNG